MLYLNVIRTWREIHIIALEAGWPHATIEFGGRGKLDNSNVTIVRSRHAVRVMGIGSGNINVLLVTFSGFKMVLTTANLK